MYCCVDLYVLALLECITTCFNLFCALSDDCNENKTDRGHRVPRGLLTILDAALVFGAPGGFAQSGIGGRSQWAVVVGAFKAGTEFI